MTVGIVGYGIYIPRCRVKREDIGKAWGSRGKGENAVLNDNEDVITMAVEASFNALEHGGLSDPKEIDAIYFGTDSAPNIEHSSIGVIGDTLGTKPEIDVFDFTLSPRVGTAAMKACIDALETGRIRYGLVIASDFRAASPGSNMESSFGAGAASYILGKDNTIADFKNSYTYSSNFRDTWRGVGEAFVKDYEPRFTREYGYTNHIIKVINGLMEKAGRTIDDFQHVILQEPDARLPRDVAKRLKISPKQTEYGSIFQDIGDTGASSVFLGMAATLDKATPGDNILGVSYGSGTSDALFITVSGNIEKRRGRSKSFDAYLGSKIYLDYARYLRSRGILTKDERPAKMGVSPLSPLLWRQGKELCRLIGAKCTNCGYVNFPPSERKICIRCGNTEFKEVVFSRNGKIHTFCVNYYMPPGFESPLPIIIADLDDGIRHRALGTEMSPDEIKIDMPVELVLRKLASENNVNLYGNVFRFPRF
ncbi:MAG: hydroxymethylglutaryl-CoA synthase [Pseudomonadota bacterium]